MRYTFTIAVYSRVLVKPINKLLVFKYPIEKRYELYKTEIVRNQYFMIFTVYISNLNTSRKSY